MIVALIGYGYWGKIVEKYINQSEVFELKKIMSPSMPNTDIFTNDIEDILSDQEIEAVIVTTPIHTHYSICKQLLQAKKHVFCEKPLTLNSIEIDELSSLARKVDRKLETNYIYLDSPSINKIKKYIHHIGQVIYVEGSLRQFGNFYKNESVYEIIGCHLISVIHYLFPNEDFTFSYHDIIRNHQDYAQFGSIRFQSSSISGQFNVSLRDINKERLLKIYGTEGIIEFNMMLNKDNLTVRLYQEQEEKLVITKELNYTFDEGNNLKAALDRFFNVIIGERASNIELSRQVTISLERGYRNGES